MDDANKWNIDSNRAQLFLLEADSDAEWAEADLALMWRHLLSRPVLLECELSDLDMEPFDHTAGSSRKGEIASFAEILFGEVLNAESVEWVRCYAKEHLNGDSDLPRVITTVLYYCAVARVRGLQSRSATRLSYQEQLEGLDWCLGQSWIDGQTESLLRRARESLANSN